MKVNIVRAQNVREYHVWKGVEIPEDLVALIGAKSLPVEQLDAELEPYLGHAPTETYTESVDDRHLHLWTERVV